MPGRYHGQTHCICFCLPYTYLCGQTQCCKWYTATACLSGHSLAIASSWPLPSTCFAWLLSLSETVRKPIALCRGFWHRREQGSECPKLREDHVKVPYDFRPIGGGVWELQPAGFWHGCLSIEPLHLRSYCESCWNMKIESWIFIGNLRVWILWFLIAVNFYISETFKFERPNERLHFMIFFGQSHHRVNFKVKL